MAVSTKKILYFTKSGSPTKDEIEAGLKLGTQRFRNARAVTDFDYIEDCDGVAGAVPSIYAKKFPVVDAPPPVSAPEPQIQVPTTPPTVDTTVAPPPPPPPPPAVEAPPWQR